MFSSLKYHIKRVEKPDSRLPRTCFEPFFKAKLLRVFPSETDLEIRNRYYGVILRDKGKNVFYSLERFVEVSFSCFQSVFQRELESLIL